MRIIVACTLSLYNLILNERLFVLSNSKFLLYYRHTTLSRTISTRPHWYRRSRSIGWRTGTNRLRNIPNGTMSVYGSQHPMSLGPNGLHFWRLRQKLHHVFVKHVVMITNDIRNTTSFFMVLIEIKVFVNRQSLASSLITICWAIDLRVWIGI